MQSRSHRHVERLIENASQFRRRQRFGTKTQRTHAPGSVAAAIHGNAVDFTQTLTEAFDQLVLPSVNLFQALLLNITNARGQPCHAENVGRTAFEKMREFTRLRFAGGVAAGAAFAPRARRDARTDVEAPVPVGPRSDL